LSGKKLNDAIDPIWPSDLFSFIKKIDRNTRNPTPEALKEDMTACVSEGEETLRSPAKEDTLISNTTMRNIYFSVSSRQ
jgi:hypothetical protein